jgi:hypothetical protein
MARFPGRKTESRQLDAVVDELPRDVASWTQEQRDRFTTQSNRAMREQNRAAQPGELA